MMGSMRIFVTDIRSTFHKTSLRRVLKMDCYLLVVVFVIKLLSQHNLFMYIKEKHRIQTLRQCRAFERLNLRYKKVQQDLKFVLTCKKENLLPTFAKPKFGIKSDHKLRGDVGKLIIKTELKNKHRLKNKLKKELIKQSSELKNATSFILYHALQYKIGIVVASRQEKWKSTHSKKLLSLRNVCKNTSNNVTVNRVFVRNCH